MNMKGVFFRQIMVLAGLIVLTVAIFWAFHAPIDQMIAGLNMVVPVSMYTMLALDVSAKNYVRKRIKVLGKMTPQEREIHLAGHKEDRDLIDRICGRYWIGVGFIFTGIALFIGASQATTGWETLGYLGAMMSSFLLGCVWMFRVYKPAIQTLEEREKERWEGLQKRFKRAKTKQDLKDLLGAHLRFYLFGDTIGGAPDVSKPVAMVDGQALTLVELKMIRAEMGEGNSAIDKKIADVDDVIELLVDKQWDKE